MSEPRPAAVIVLAAGEGTRMKSKVPKMLHPLCGRSMLGHALAAAAELTPDRLIVVAGHARDQVQAEAERQAPGVTTVVQDQQNGTGHAVRMVFETLGAIRGPVLVTYGDMPLLRPGTLRELASAHREAGNAVTVLTAAVPDPSGYGRIIRDPDGGLAAIVEERDATQEQRAVTEINSGCYAFDGELLDGAIKRVGDRNAQGQEYLTDVIAILRGDGHRAGAVRAADPAEIAGINDRVQLAAARKVLNQRLCERWMRAGVTITDPATTWIDVQVVLEPDAELRPGTHLEGRTRVGADAVVGPDCRLTDTVIGAGATVSYTVARDAELGPDASAGPFAYLRPGARIGAGAHIGTYVELKNAEVGPGAKVPHLSYVGDADIGAGANIGAGTIFANYDGVRKHHSSVGEAAFVGSDSVLIAPVRIGAGAYTAAGSAIIEDVPPGALGVARGRQHTVPGWTERRRPGTRSAEAAAAASRAGAEASQAEAAAAADVSEAQGERDK